MPNQEWDIKPRGTACRHCQTPFADRQTYASCLTVGAEDYERCDYCLACWAARTTDPRDVSTWKAVYKAPPPPPPEPIRRETAETLLRSLIANGDPTQRNVIFILAVMLERRRLLVERDVQVAPDGATRRVYEHRKTGESFLVTDPQLHLDQLEQVQQEVVTLLGGPSTEKNAECVTPSAPPAKDGDNQNGIESPTPL